VCGAVSEEDLAMKHFTRTIGASPDTPKTAFAEINAAHQAKTIKKPNCNKKKRWFRYGFSLTQTSCRRRW
jgi:hypothetical protein